MSASPKSQKGKGIASIPTKIEIQGILVKAGGKQGQKKKEHRYFTLGDNMIAYFKCKDAAHATLKTAAGTFPIGGDSCVERLGAAVTIKGFKEPLFPFAITSEGRRFQLWCEDRAECEKWVEAVEIMIEYLDSRTSAITDLDKSISSFTTAADSICAELAAKSTEMQVVFKDASEKLVGHKDYLQNKFKESMESDNPSQARKAATMEMDKDAQTVKRCNEAMDEVVVQFHAFMSKMQEAADNVAKLGEGDGEEAPFVPEAVEAVDEFTGEATGGDGGDGGEEEDGEGEEDEEEEGEPEPEA